MKVKSAFLIIFLFLLAGGGYWFFSERNGETGPQTFYSPSVDRPPKDFFGQLIERKFPQRTFKPLPSGSYYFPFPSGEVMVTDVVEGVVTQTERGKFVITANGREFSLLIDEKSLFRFLPGGKGATVGARLRVYYREENGELYVVFGDEIK